MSNLDETDFLLVGDEDFSFDPTSVDSFDVGLPDFREQKDIKYPAMLLSNVLFLDCLHVLKSIKKESYRTVDTWVELADNEGFQNIGTLQLDSEVLLVLRHLHVNVTLYYDHDNVETLNLNDPAVVERFI